VTASGPQRSETAELLANHSSPPGLAGLGAR
jgi:hypothetical protein